jgi:hypothetical protein
MTGPVPTDGHCEKTAFVSVTARFGLSLGLADCPASKADAQSDWFNHVNAHDHDHGGHFIPWENPVARVSDLRRTFHGGAARTRGRASSWRGAAAPIQRRPYEDSTGGGVVPAHFFDPDRPSARHAFLCAVITALCAVIKQFDHSR